MTAVPTYNIRGIPILIIFTKVYFLKNVSIARVFSSLSVYPIILSSTTIYRTIKAEVKYLYSKRGKYAYF